MENRRIIFLSKKNEALWQKQHKLFKAQMLNELVFKSKVEANESFSFNNQESNFCDKLSCLKFKAKKRFENKTFLGAIKKLVKEVKEVKFRICFNCDIIY